MSLEFDSELGIEMGIVQRILIREVLGSSRGQEVSVGGDEDKSRQTLRLHDLAGHERGG